MTRIARLLALAALAAAGLARAEESVGIELDAPASGEPVRGVRGMGFVAGHVLGRDGERPQTDLMIAIDVSDSTRRPSGGDVDGDGKKRGGWEPKGILSNLNPILTVGGLLTDKTDTVLAAEIVAARNLLDQLDPRLTRVGVLTFSGDMDERSLDASVIVPLTGDYDEVRKALDAELARGPGGMTNISAGISLATAELIGARSARSTLRQGASKLVVLFSDGRPTLPYPRQIDDNRALAVRAARRAARSGIRIQTYGVGDEADAGCLERIAKVSSGSYTDVLQPGDLRAAVAKVDVVGVGELAIENLANGAQGRMVRTPDGAFFALVPMQAGPNFIQITARTSEIRLQRRFTLELQEDADVASGAPQDPMQARVRGELFAVWLAEQAAPASELSRASEAAP